MLLWLAWHSQRTVRVGKAVAANGVEVLCEVVDVSRRRSRRGTVLADVYRVAVPGSSAGSSATVEIPIEPSFGTPLSIRPGLVLALQSASTGRQPLLLRQNLWPLLLSHDEIRGIAARFQRVNPDGGWRAIETSKGPKLVSASSMAERAEVGRAECRSSQGRSWSARQQSGALSWTIADRLHARVHDGRADDSKPRVFSSFLIASRSQPRVDRLSCG